MEFDAATSDTHSSHPSSATTDASTAPSVVSAPPAVGGTPGIDAIKAIFAEMRARAPASRARFEARKQQVLDDVKLYCGLGWTLIPCHVPDRGLDEYSPGCSCAAAWRCGTPAKHPIDKGYDQLASSDVRVQEARWRNSRSPAIPNVGLLIEGSGVWVADVDARNGGVVTYDRLVAEHGPLPVTPTVLSGSGSGSMHKLFKGDPRLASAPKGISSLPGIDILTGGKQLSLLPGSRHASGRLYEWLHHPGSTPVAAAPEWLIEIILNAGQVQQEEAALRAFDAQKRAQARAAAVATGTYDDSWDKAYERYRLLKTPKWATRNSLCPLCASPDGFKAHPFIERAWICKSSRHDSVAVGFRTPDGYWRGDIIDIDMHRLGLKKRWLVLKAAGLLPR